MNNFLGCYEDVMKVLLPNLNEKERKDVFYFCWYDMVLTGIKG
jgi:hypothetical protein